MTRFAVKQAAWRALYGSPPAEDASEGTPTSQERQEAVLDALRTLLDGFEATGQVEVQYHTEFVIPEHLLVVVNGEASGYPRQERRGVVSLRLTFDVSPRNTPALHVSYPYGYAGHVARGIATFRRPDKLDIRVAEDLTRDQAIDDLFRVLID